jgi:hypothetical protein
MTATVISNRISLTIPDDALQRINAAVQTLQADLLPHLVDLGTEDRRAMPRMGDKTIAFVSKALSYVRGKPEYKPGFVDIDEFQRDVDAVGLLRPLQRELGQLKDMLDDSLAVAGSEAYTAALASYQTIKFAAKMNQPGAATMFDDLRVRFLAQGRVAKPVPPAAVPEAPAPVPTEAD